MKKDRTIAFVVELLLLFVILLVVIVVITQTFMRSRSQSLYARHLTEAVTLAETVAEVSAAAENQDQAAELFGEMEQVRQVEREEGGQTGLAMEFAEDSGARDNYRVEVDWLEEPAGRNGSARYIAKQIRVYFDAATEPIYTLDTGNYQPAE